MNNTAATNRDLTPYQDFYSDLEPLKATKPNLSRYKVIGAICEVYIPQELRAKGLKLAARTETGRLLAVLGSNTYLVYIPKRHSVIQTSILKIYKVPKLGFSYYPDLEQDSRSLEGEDKQDNLGTDIEADQADDLDAIPSSQLPTLEPGNRQQAVAIPPSSLFPSPPSLDIPRPPQTLAPATTPLQQPPASYQEPRNIEDPMDVDIVHFLNNSARESVIIVNNTTKDP